MSKIFRKLLSGLIVLMLFFGYLPQYTQRLDSATYTGGNLTLGDSRPSTSASYTFDFDNVTTSAIKCIKVVLATTATGSTAPTGINTTGVTYSAANSDYIPDVQTWTAAEIASGSFKITNATGETPASATNATFQVTGITNGSTADTAYYAQVSTYNNIDCATTGVDSGTVAFIYTTGQTVSATVDPTLTFTIAAVNSGQVIKSGSSTNTTITTTTSTIPFATLSAATAKYAAHTLTVSTNASSGYGVTIKTAADPPMSDSTNNIDKFTGTNASPAAWSSPNGSSANVNTGWLGYTTDDVTTLGGGTANRFAGDVFAGPDTTAVLVADSTTGQTSQANKVAYAIEVNAIQPGGSYTGTVIFTATPTY